MTNPVLQALDEAVAECATRNYDRLRTGLRGRERAKSINDALKSLSLLQEGGEPSYGPWDSLFYLTWYQPRQIHLAYAVLRQLYPRGFQSPVHVIDLGCGAWAVQFALALWTTNERKGGDPDQVIVHGIEPSVAMRRLGGELWDALRGTADRYGLTALVETVDAMTVRCVTYESLSAYAYSPAVRDASRFGCGLTSLHAVYESTFQELGEQVAWLRSERKVNWEIFTTHRSKRRELEAVVEGGFGPRLLPQPLWEGPKPIWEGCLPRTTAWRRRLARVFSSLTGKSRTYLSKAVTWNPEKNRIEKDAVWVRTS